MTSTVCGTCIRPSRVTSPGIPDTITYLPSKRAVYDMDVAFNGKRAVVVRLDEFDRNAWWISLDPLILPDHILDGPSGAAWFEMG